jgi:hypothetical protein
VYYVIVDVLESLSSGVFLENEIILETEAGLSLYRDLKLFNPLRDSEMCIFRGMNSVGEPLRNAINGTGEFGDAYVYTQAVRNIQSFAVLVDAAVVVLYDANDDKFYVTNNHGDNACVSVIEKKAIICIHDGLLMQLYRWQPSVDGNVRR